MCCINYYNKINAQSTNGRLILGLTLKYVNINGFTVKIDERIQLNLSLGQVKCDLKVDKV